MPLFRGCTCFSKGAPQQGSILPEKLEAESKTFQRPSCPVEDGHVCKIAAQYEEGSPVPLHALVQHLAGLSDEDMAELLVKVKTLRETGEIDAEPEAQDSTNLDKALSGALG